MQIARFEPLTSVEGPGKRTAVWFQGCSIRCQQCCNPQMFNADARDFISVTELASRIAEAATRTDGLSLLGGEPLDQAFELISLLQNLRNFYKKGIILFTGYTWQQIQANSEKMQAVGLCDLIIAGPYIAAHASESRRWIGSDNQTLHFITEYYADLQREWPLNKREIEIILRDGLILLNGTPLGDDHEVSRILRKTRETID
ncbi:MAG: radical SAM protein [Candidatus Riflebacteria bacterium]|nr:radical SAM protein [Candidatus Riflebacteria bacterium]